MIRIELNDWSIEFILCPLFGIAVGVNYYNPTLDDEEVDEEDYYNDLTFLFALFALKVRWWKN